MTTTALSLDEIHALAYEALTGNGADHENASALANTIMTAERDGSISHGLFRLPAYIASLRTGKANGKARPQAERLSPAVIRVDGDHAYAPMVQAVGLPLLIEAAKETGVAMLALTRTHHMAALWPEVEALANEGLAGFACVSYMPSVAPAGASKAFFGTNPIAFAWPRPGKSPLCYDMATASMAMGEVQVAAREGHSVPEGTGLDKNGEPTTDPAAIADGGVLLPFGGYKGSAIAMMVELLAAGLVGEQFSYEAKENDNGDGGPPQGGEFILAMDPARIAGAGWEDHCEAFFERLTGLDGTRLPGARRHKNRLDAGPRHINTALVEKIRSLMV
ncbi:MAG: Ldh family oxidoreductase [Candidatus Puniceispirillales bacterium]